MNNEDWLRSALERIEAKQDEHSVLIAKIDTTLKSYVKETEEIKKELEPIKSHVSFINTAGKVGATLVGVVAALKSLHIF